MSCTNQSFHIRIMIMFLALFYVNNHAFSAPVGQNAEEISNVQNKLYPRKRHLDLNIDAGLVLNQPLITTFLIHGSLTYYSSETTGFNIEGAMGLNRDSSNRECLETFYNDTKDTVDDECGPPENLDNTTSNYGPAYMPIREIKFIVAANYMWTPVYAKQLLFLSQTMHFDVYFPIGGGVVMSDYYEQRTTLNNGQVPRATFNEATGRIEGGARTDETDSYGEAGRPEAQSQVHPMINLGIGQRYHFAKRFELNFEIRNMLLLGTPSGFENLLALWGGIGMRF